MKKILSILLFVFVSFVGINIVKAETVTFDEVANKYKEKFDYTKIDETLGSYLQEIEDHSTVTTTSNSIVVKYEGENGTVTTTFTHQNGIINYKYSGSKEYNENTLLTTAIDSIAMVKLLYIVCELKGYDLTSSNNIFEEENLTLEKNGFEVKRFTVSESTDTSSASLTAAETFRLDLNKFNLEGNSSSNITSNNTNTTYPTNTNTSVDNPNTGYEKYIISSLLILVALLIVTKIKSSKDLINKI